MASMCHWHRAGALRCRKFHFKDKLCRWIINIHLKVHTWVALSLVCINHVLAALNHAPAVLGALALIYSMHWLLVVWIIVAHFHLCSLLDHYTVLEDWAVRRPMHVCCGSQWGQCVLFINVWDSLTAPCLVYNMAMYTVYGQCGQCGRCMVCTDPFISGLKQIHLLSSVQ